MINFEDGVLVTPAKVNQDGTITPAQYSGKTPLSAYNLNKMQELTEIYTGTNISAKTVDGGCKIRKIYGHLKQSTRSGKNKFISLGNNTIAGITITENEDGTYNFSGTAAANIEHTAFINVEKSDIKNGSTYILSSTKTLPNGLSSRVERYTDSAWLGQFITSITSTIPTRTGVADTTDTTRFRFGIFISSGTTLNIQNVGFQLEEGTSATEYEPYGVSPSLNYPSEIQVVGDNVNLFDKDNIIIGKNINSTTGNIEENNVYSVTDFIKIDNKNITISFDGKKSKYNKMSVGEYDENYIFIKRQTNDDTTLLQHTFSLSDNTRYIKYSYRNDVGITNIKIEKGTVATSYTSYGNGGIDYKTVGKNLIGVKDTSSSTNLGITAEYDSSTGIYTLNGTSTNAGYIKLYDVLEVSTYANLNTRNRTLMSKGDYTLSYKYVSGSKTTGTANIMIRDCDDSTTTPRFEINKIGIENKQLQFTVDEEYSTQKYIWFASGITFTNFKFTIQLENGSVVTEHEAYQEKDVVIELPENEFLAKIGDVQDYIDNQGVLHKYIKKSVGSELGWRLGGTQNYEDSLIFYSLIKDAKFDNNLNNNIKSTHFKSGNSYSNNNEAVGIMSTGEFGIRVKKSTVATLEDFITWLDENDVEMYYELATPYEIDLKYNNILPQYKEMTNISCSAISEIETTTSPAIASVNETISKISDETVAINSDCPNNKNVWIQKNDNLIGTLKINDIDTATGLEVEYDKFVITQDYIPVESNTNYYAEYVSNSSGGKQIVVYEYDNNHNYLDYHHINDKTYYFSTSSNSAYIKIRFMETNINITAVLRKGDQKIWTKNNGIYEEFINIDDVISNQFKRNDRYDSTDFNNFTKNGFYMVNVQKCTNAPNPYATGMLLVFGSYYISQLFIADLNGTTVGYMRISSDKGNTWNNWSQITTKE